MPTLPDTFLGKVRITSLRRLVDVEAELRARPDVTGWEPRSEGGTLSFKELRALLPTYTEGEGEAAVHFLEGGRMGDIVGAGRLTTAAAPLGEYADEVVGDRVCCIM